MDIPHGVAGEDYTNWIVAKDLTHKALYYRTYNDLTVRVIYLDKVQPEGKKLKLPLSTPVRGFKDTTMSWKLLMDMGTPNCWKLLMGGIRNSKEQNPETNHTNQALKATNKIIVSRGVARGGPGGPPPPPW